MQLAATCELSDLLALAFSLRRNLVGPASFSIQEDGSRITVKGRLNLSHEDIVTRSTALCTFIIPANWKQRQPRVWCHETWRTSPLPGGGCNAEWHVLGDGSLCYELPHRWIDEVAAAEQVGGSDAVLELASDWVLNSVRWLLYRHLEAFRRGLKNWDDEWLAWGHFGVGPREYTKMKRRTAQARQLQAPLR